MTLFVVATWVVYAVWFALGLTVVWLRRGPVLRNAAAVVVGGDFARSPRMQYHAGSLVKHGFKVYCVGLDFGNLLTESLRTGKNDGMVNTRFLFPPFVPFCAGNWILRTVQRVIVFVGSFLYAFVAMPRVRVVFIQTPPAIPILPIAQLICFLRGITMVVDWHNFGYTLLEIDHRPKPIVHTYRMVEQYCGNGNINLCVSKSIQTFLRSNWGVRAHVAYDTPPAFFGRCSVDEFMTEVVGTGELPSPPWQLGPQQSAKPAKRSGAKPRPLTFVSATSWTADDDYSMVLDAFTALDQRLRDAKSDQKVWMVITGKGEGRQAFDDAVAAVQGTFTHVAITTAYFQSYRNYARMLGVADIGISVHSSSSGLDLPMKVVDMFGCGLPVCTVEYPALSELIDEHTAWTFRTAADLTTLLFNLVAHPSGAKEIELKQRKVLETKSARWDDVWDSVVLPLIQ